MLRYAPRLLFVVALSTSALAAQTPKVFFACYVPSSGTVYRIREAGLPQECTDSKKPSAPPHVEFSWTDGAQAVRAGDAASGDLSGTFPNPTVAALLGRPLATTAPSHGQLLVWNNSSGRWEPTTPADAQLQTRVSGNCSVGSSIRQINADGSVECEGTGITGHEIVEITTNPTVVPGLSFLTGQVACPSGKSVVGGGHASVNGSHLLTLAGSFPSSASTWRVVLFNPALTPVADQQARVFAVCAVVR